MSRKSPTRSKKSKRKPEQEASTEPPVTPSEKARGYLREALFLGVLVLSVLSARSILADHYYVPTPSMVPTVQISDHLVVNKLAYGLRIPFTEHYLARFEGPKRGDVVVLESPTDGIILLKRVVAEPGDRVRIAGGQLVLNGHLVPVHKGEDGQLVEALDQHPHLVQLTEGGGPGLDPELHGANALGEATVPDGHYLVMGDNRGRSRDGRMFGWVKREVILGRAIAIYWRHAIVWRPL